MTTSEYGPWLPVNGKRPEWLKDEDRIQWTSSRTSRAYWHEGVEPWKAKIILDWCSKKEIRLPKDHWIYQVRNNEESVTILKMTEKEVIKRFKVSNAGAVIPVLWELGIIREETLLDKFKAEYPLLSRSDMEIAEIIFDWVNSRV